MAKYQLVKASTNVTIYIFIQDSSSTTGAGLTGLVFNTASLVCYYVRPLAVAVQLTLATQTVTGAHSDGGFVEVDSTNTPGLYRLDLSDAILAAGVDGVTVMLKGATNMAPLLLEIQLTDLNLNDGVRGGLTALPNAVADAAGGLPISDAGGLDLDGMNTTIDNIETDTQNIQSRIPAALVGGRIDANIGAISADATAADNLEADYDGTGYDKSASTIGTTTTNTDMRGTDNAALATVLGALADAAADGDPTNTDTAMQYIKQLINILIGTDGITTFPAAAAPANNVSLAEVIRAIYVDTNSLNDGTIPEITGIADAPATPTLKQAAMLTYMRERNNTQATNGERRIYNDAGSEVLDAVMSDDTVTFQQGKLTDA